jgi:hypothetical protein
MNLLRQTAVEAVRQYGAVNYRMLFPLGRANVHTTVKTPGASVPTNIRICP